jgi:hypothetical protein
MSVLAAEPPVCARRLTLTEWRERAIERTPADEHALECAAEEPDGAVCVWNGAGGVVEVAARDRTALAGLLLADQLLPRHAAALVEALRRLPHSAGTCALRELAYLLARIVPH